MFLTVSMIGEAKNGSGPSKDTEKHKLTTDVRLPRAADSTPAVRLPSRRRPEPLLQAKSLPAHIQKLNNNIEVDVLTNKIPQLSVDGTKMDLNITDYVVIDSIDDIFHRAVSHWHLLFYITYQV